MADSMEEVPAVREEHLVEALGPTQALHPAGFEGNGLLVEELGRRIANLDVVRAAECGELDVLRKRVEVPPVHALDDLARDEPARA